MAYADKFKVWGPYTRKDNRKIVIVVDRKGRRRTVSYPKWIMEMHLGRKLHPDKETVDHWDSNFDNNDLSNLKLVPRKEHSANDTRRVRMVKYNCAWCEKEFERSPRLIRDKAKKKKSGPFCSRSCAGKYSRMIQLKLINKFDEQQVIDSEYYKRKYEKTASVDEWQEPIDYLDLIAYASGKDEKLEIERKFLVKLPNSWDELSKLFDNMVNVERIVQFYLKPEKSQPSARVRKTIEGLSGDTKTYYTYNLKHKTDDDAVHKEEEKKISEEEYNKYVKQCHPDKREVEKTRFVFKYQDQVFELDIFKGHLQGLAILELELDSSDDKIKLPPFLAVIKEVTEDDKYNNFNLANKK